MLAADILDHPAAFDLLEDLDNLVLAEFRFSHFRFSVVNYYYPQEPLKITGPILGEVYSPIRQTSLNSEQAYPIMTKARTAGLLSIQQILNLFSNYGTMPVLS